MTLNNTLFYNLSDVVEMRGGGTPSTDREEYWSGNIPWVSPKDMKFDVISDSEDHISTKAIQESATNLIPQNSCLVVVRSGILARTIPIGLNSKKVAINQDIKALIPSDSLNPKYLFYFLRSVERPLLSKVTRGATVHRLSSNDLCNLRCPVPALSEQKRIVEILDEAFDGIAKATANVQRNLIQAMDIFQSRLDQSVSQQIGAYGTTQLMDASLDITDGDHQPPPKAPSGIPFITISNIDKDHYVINFSDTFYVPKTYYEQLKLNRKPKKGDVLYSVTGSFGIPVVVKSDKAFCFQRHIGLIRPIPAVSSEWLAFSLRSSHARQQAEAQATGTAQRTVSLKALRALRIPNTPTEKQIEIVKQLTDLQINANSLTAIYAKKLKLLEELRASLLHKAFTGQLTPSSVVPAVQKLESPMTATARLTAQVIVLAHYRHASKHRDRTFGHVKAQKILHLAESFANIPLARRPIKDAAGPNDFAHMLRAEQWAENNGCFQFNQRDIGYSLQKLGGYNQLLTGADETLKPFKQKLDKILELLIPMNKQEAEVFTTVHAAWNNLIVDRKPITDDAIIKEAREDWHEEKLKIPKAEFLKAIRLIEKEGMIPDGTAKAVRRLQEKLL